MGHWSAEHWRGHAPQSGRNSGLIFRGGRRARAHVRHGKPSRGARGAPGGGRGGGGSTMPQCSPSARPRNKAQWLHCQQAFSCTLRGLPDTRPLLFFNNSTTTFSGAGATVGSSAAGLKEAILRSTAAVSDCFRLSFIPTLRRTCLQENGRLSPRRR